MAAARWRLAAGGYGGRRPDPFRQRLVHGRNGRRRRHAVGYRGRGRAFRYEPGHRGRRDIYFRPHDERRRVVCVKQRRRLARVGNHGSRAGDDRALAGGPLECGDLSPLFQTPTQGNTLAVESNTNPKRKRGRQVMSSLTLRVSVEWANFNRRQYTGPTHSPYVLKSGGKPPHSKGDIMGLWNRFLSGRKKPWRQGVKPRRLLVEPLEARRLLSVSPPTSLAALLASETPDPHPTGDPPSATATVIALAAYVPAAIFDPGIAVLEPLIQGEEQIESNILSNPAARPSFWGEPQAAGTGQYQLYLCDNGMLVSQWTIDWGDGSASATSD